MTPADRAARVHAELWPAEGREGWSVYAILDGARDPRVYPAVQGSGLSTACLYAGKLPEPMIPVAPYLVQLEKNARFTKELLETAWGESWGVFALSSATLEELRRHLRRFLKVKDEAGSTLLFRFYDPRVLRVYLPTCNAAELGLLFGPVGMYLVEGEEPSKLHRFYRKDGALEVESPEV